MHQLVNMLGLATTTYGSTHALVASWPRVFASRPRQRVGAWKCAASSRAIETEETSTTTKTEGCRPEAVFEDGNVVEFANNADVPVEEDITGVDDVVMLGLEQVLKEHEKLGEQDQRTLLTGLAVRLSGLVNWSGRVRGLVLLNVMTFIMATNWVVVKDAETMLDPFTFSFLRFTVAAVAFLPFLRSTAAIRGDVLKAGVELGAWSALGYITQSVGLLTTDASRASFLSAFTVILVPIIAGVAGKGVPKQTWLAALVALFGTALLEQGGGSEPGLGDIFNLLSAAFFAVQIVRTEHWSRDMADSSNELLATSLATTSVVSGVLAVATHPTESLSILQNLGTLHTAQIPWNEILYTGVMSTDLVLFIELVALHHVSSTDAAIVYTMEPVLGALMAYVVLGDRWGPAGWIGAALILMSSLGTQLMGTSRKTEGIHKEKKA